MTSASDLAAAEVPAEVEAAIDFVAHSGPADRLATAPRARATKPREPSVRVGAAADPQGCLFERVTPQCLRTAYGLNDTAATYGGFNAQTVVVNQGFKRSDVAAFERQGKLPSQKVVKEVGKNDNQAGDEATLDVEFIIAILAHRREGADVVGVHRRAHGQPVRLVAHVGVEHVADPVRPLALGRRARGHARVRQRRPEGPRADERRVRRAGRARRDAGLRLGRLGLRRRAEVPRIVAVRHVGRRHHARRHLQARPRGRRRRDHRRLLVARRQRRPRKQLPEGGGGALPDQDDGHAP